MPAIVNDPLNEQERINKVKESFALYENGSCTFYEWVAYLKSLITQTDLNFQDTINGWTVDAAERLHSLPSPEKI